VPVSENFVRQPRLLANDTVSKPAKRIHEDERFSDPLDTPLLYERLYDDDASNPVTAANLEAKRRPRPRSHLPLLTWSTANQPVNIQQHRERPIGGLGKRLLDILIAAVGLILLSPLFVIVPLLIYLTMGRPIIFTHRRLGFRGRRFECLKFRTMINGAESALQLHLAENPAAAREWHDARKLRQDPRITVLGQMLRRSSLDELPQLFNVLLGDMSCVGPRPVVDSEIANYGEYWGAYTQARPGITGAWQVGGRNRVPYDQRVKIDRLYVRRWSMWRDVKILIRTLPALLRTDETG
jgi:exopolysaccharide production protein ExoY